MSGDLNCFAKKIPNYDALTALNYSSFVIKGFFRRIATFFLFLFTLSVEVFAEGKRGGTLRVAMNRAFDGFDTATNPTVFPTKLNVQRAIFEDLFGVDKKGKLIPKLGTSLKISPDQKLFTVTLRKDLKFSNGEALTARAYSDHFKRAMKSPRANFIKGQIGPVKEVVAVDDHTIEFRLSLIHI
mgnify:CR=1 FL=1